MNPFKFTLLFALTISIFTSCDLDLKEEEEKVERTTHIVTLENNTGITGCAAGGQEVTFLVSYRDIQVDVDVAQERSAIINVLVEDDESINIQVQRTSDDSPLANTNINVRTSSRPAHLEDEHRRISFCRAFDLIFSNF